MADFDDFKQAVQAGLDDLAVNTIGDYADAARVRANNFLVDAQQDLEKWLNQLGSGELSADDFEFLVKGKAELGQINALLEIGAAKAAVDRFRAGFIQLLKDSALAFMP
jgi:uncharacterized protein YdgA (DUF945 family)